MHNIISSIPEEGNYASSRRIVAARLQIGPMPFSRGTLTGSLLV